MKNKYIQYYLDIFKDYTYVLDFIAPSKKKEDITNSSWRLYPNCSARF